ncbi:hypothetical protein VTN02DRAFT_3768 [Thermoascus thermophilus]
MNWRPWLFSLASCAAGWSFYDDLLSQVYRAFLFICRVDAVERSLPRRHTFLRPVSPSGHVSSTDSWRLWSEKDMTAWGVSDPGREPPFPRFPLGFVAKPSSFFVVVSFCPPDVDRPEVVRSGLMTVTSLVMPNRRGEAAGKQPLRLPIIAPKDVSSSSTSSGLSANVNAPHLTVPARVRLPPRSRTGCWTCRVSTFSLWNASGHGQFS